jgi:hypothetical protein
MAAGTVGFLEIAPRYEQWKASVGSLISGLTPSSAENVWWDIVRVALIIVGVSIISSDILSRIKTRLNPDREIEDFRNGVATEMHSLLKMFIDPLHHWDISYPSWSSKAEQSKATILGKEDYLVLRSLYDAIEERNRYFASRRGMSVDEVDPLNRKCVEAFSRAYSEVTWLKIASDTDSLLSNARKSIGLL